MRDLKARSSQQQLKADFEKEIKALKESSERDEAAPEEIRADVLEPEKETEGLLDEILGKGGSV